jgi:hypothetical protein
MIFRTRTFSGDAGKHDAKDGSECPGRAFDVMSSGAGAVNASIVKCTMCGSELTAFENGLSGPAPYSATA